MWWVPPRSGQCTQSLTGELKPGLDGFQTCKSGPNDLRNCFSVSYINYYEANVQGEATPRKLQEKPFCNCCSKDTKQYIDLNGFSIIYMLCNNPVLVSRYVMPFDLYLLYLIMNVQAVLGPE